jgi:hypothetical protein
VQVFHLLEGKSAPVLSDGIDILGRPRNVRWLTSVLSIFSIQFNSIQFWFINVPSQQPDGQLQKQHNKQTQITMDKEWL